MDKVTVTLMYGPKKQVDLLLPAEVPHQFLAEAVARALALPISPQAQYVMSVVAPEGKKRLTPAATLASANVFAGSYLELAQEELNSRSGSFLVTESGIRFPLQADNTIGRKDIKDKVHIDIDLGPLAGKVISHSHASIRAVGGNDTLIDTGSTNGTWVNGAKLEANCPYILRDKDVIDFGPRGKGVTLTYREG